jgi:pantoate--beta-alanine ligase
MPSSERFMRIITSVTAMQRQARRWQRSGDAVALVPTMGYLHAGHASLMERARKLVGQNGSVVVSIYVNPAQFGPKEDFSKYPRDLARDVKLCRAADVDVLFTPADKEIYPADFCTYVQEEKLSRGMEGASRPAHFRGVTTIVAKLFNLVLPTIAVFGAKDFQQAAVVRRMVHDLNFPIKIAVAPTLREPDGLAMSSRNKYLTPVQREQSVVLWQAIKHAQKAVTRQALAASRLKDEIAQIVAEKPEARLDYVELFDPETLRPVPSVSRGTHMALAVFVGKTRLIDNALL